MPVAAARIAAVRRFNRFYTRRIGVLDEHLLGSDFALVEVRVLYELAHAREPLTAKTLQTDLGVDAGYMSRLLRNLERRKLIRRERAAHDARTRPMALTPAGKRTFAKLDAESEAHVAALLGELDPPRQALAIAAMEQLEAALSNGDPRSRSVTLREPRPGDLGWVVERHGAIYAEEYGWNVRFEALVARIVADFVEKAATSGERCWIAEHGGERVGSIFLVRKSATTAKLRLLLVEPGARGLGVGGRLVDECIAFARTSKYRRIELWTNDVLHAARRIYERAGFRLVHEEPNHAFGPALVAQTWRLEL